jgi:hypothetical protein
MAVAFDSEVGVSGEDSRVTSLSTNMTSSGSDRIGLLSVTKENPGIPPTGITWGSGNNMTNVGSEPITANSGLFTYYYLAPATASTTVTVSFASAYAACTIMTFNGVVQSDPPDVGSDEESANSISHTVTSYNYVVSICAWSYVFSIIMGTLDWSPGDGTPNGVASGGVLSNGNRQWWIESAYNGGGSWTEDGAESCEVMLHTIDLDEVAGSVVAPLAMDSYRRRRTP